MRGREHERPHHAQAGGVRGHHEAADALVFLRAIGGGEHGIEIGDPGVRNERLGARQDVAIAGGLGGRAERRDVGAGIRFRHGERRHRAALDRRLEPALAHRVVVRKQHRDDAERLERKDGVGQRGSRGQRLPHDAAGAPVLVADRLQPAGGAQCAEQLAGLKARGGVILGLCERRELARGEFAHALRQRHMFVVEKGANRRGVNHQMNLGSRLPRKASCASRKFGPCISCAWTSAS